MEAFISYSHADEKMLERLHKHLAMLQREGTLTTWSDHSVLPGSQLGSDIDQNLDRSDLFLALLSPDYLASRYCYEREFQHALKLAEAGRIRIVPIILEPCDWLASPFSQFLALPKDGKPISEWTNHNNAFLDVVTGLRRVLTAPRSVAPEAAPAPGGRELAGRRPRIKQDFDVIQRGEFADRTYEATRAYFETSCVELNDVGEGHLKARFEVMDRAAFTCTVVNRAKRSGGEAHITVRNNKGRHGIGDISYLHEAHGREGAANGWISIEADDYNLYASFNNFGGSGGKEAKLSPQQVAERLWDDFVERAGILYE